MALNETKLYDSLEKLALTTIEKVRQANSTAQHSTAQHSKMLILFSTFCNSFRCRKAHSLN